MQATVFLVTSEATVDGVVRRIEAVLDVSVQKEVRLLSWRAL